MLKHTGGALLLAALVTSAACDGGNLFGSTRVPTGGATAGSISGSVQAGGSGVGGVTVLLGTADSTVTNTAGAFTFANLLPATYDLAVRVPLGYAPAAGETGQRTVTVPAAGGTATVSFALQRTTTGAF